MASHCTQDARIEPVVSWKLPRRRSPVFLLSGIRLQPLRLRFGAADGGSRRRERCRLPATAPSHWSCSEALWIVVDVRRLENRPSGFAPMRPLRIPFIGDDGPGRDDAGHEFDAPPSGSMRSSPVERERPANPRYVLAGAVIATCGVQRNCPRERAESGGGAPSRHRRAGKMPLRAQPGITGVAGAARSARQHGRRGACCLLVVGRQSVSGFDRASVTVRQSQCVSHNASEPPAVVGASSRHGRGCGAAAPCAAAPCAAPRSAAARCGLLGTRSRGGDGYCGRPSPSIAALRNAHRSWSRHAPSIIR